MRLGIIADDFTGATDIASFLVENGLTTLQYNGVPKESIESTADALVISLKSRSCAKEQAIKDSLAALHWLQQQNCTQFFFKYCSTFDSTRLGNIGPVTDALLHALNEEFTVICPALPVNGRTVYNGYLFVNGIPLNESGMRDHPVTPMIDSNIMRLMEAQAEGRAKNINHNIIDKGVDAVKASIKEFQKQNIAYAVCDALNDKHIAILGEAVKELTLVTGGSGLADGIAKAWHKPSEDSIKAQLAGAPIMGAAVVISGSCSQMTNAQVTDYKDKAPSFAVDVARAMHDENYYKDIAAFVVANKESTKAPMVYATMAKQQLQEIQQRFGAKQASAAVENLLAKLAKELQKNGFVRFIIAGGETSGAVTQALNIHGFTIGPKIAPGVPWVRSLDGKLSLALKSGNFGQEDFFSIAQENSGSL